MRLIVPVASSELWQGGTPEDVSASHPLWADVVKEAGPWSYVSSAPGLVGGGHQAQVALERTAQDGQAEAKVVVVLSCQSSFDVAHKLLAQGLLAPFDSVLAVRQQEGRGQYRRQWHSPVGNLHACLVLPPMPAVFDRLAPLWVGLVVVRTLREVYGLPDVALKWPNDVLVGGVKIAGILLEERGGHVVAGVGVNVAHAPDSSWLRAQSATQAGCLGKIVRQEGLLGLWRTLVETAQKLYGIQLRSQTPDLFLRDVAEVLAWKGERIIVQADDDPQATTFEAFLIGVAEDGSLDLVRADGLGRIRCASGSIRLAS